MKKAALAFLLLCLAAFSSSSNDSYPVPDLYSFSLELTVPENHHSGRRKGHLYGCAEKPDG